MKRLLYGTTALVSAGVLASSAQAEGGIKLGLGGYMNNFFGGGWIDDDSGADKNHRNTGLFSDGEIWFVGETTLDNGLTFGVNVQLESFGDTADTIDEDFGYMQGSFGRLNFGSENTAAYLMQYSAPTVGIPINSGWITSFVPVPDSQRAAFRSPGLSTYLDIGNDENQITYFTPRLYGFQVGASYAPAVVYTGNGKNFPIYANEKVEYHDGVSVGLNFVDTLWGVDVAAAGGWRKAFAPDGELFILNPETGFRRQKNISDQEQVSFGLNLGYAGFTFGGSYANEIQGRVRPIRGSFGPSSIDGVGSLFPTGFFAGPNSNISPVAANAVTVDSDSTEGWSMDLGLSYGTGPWTFGVQYFRGENEGSTEDGDNNKVHAGRLGVEYAVGPGITASVSALYAWWRPEVGAEDSEGAVGAVGLNFGF